MFNFNDAQESAPKTGSKYQSPGIEDNVKIVDVLIELTSKNKVPYLRLVTENSNGAKGSSSKMYLNTTPKVEGGKPAFDITRDVILQLIQATNNVDFNTAKSLMGTPQTIDDLRNKISAIVVGKPFRAKFNGEMTAKNNIYAVMAGSESMRVNPTKLNPNIKIKEYVGAENKTDTETLSEEPSTFDF